MEIISRAKLIRLELDNMPEKATERQVIPTRRRNGTLDAGDVVVCDHDWSVCLSNY